MGFPAPNSPPSPVPVVKLDAFSQLIQGGAGVGPEGDVSHLSDKLSQLALEFLHDGHVVCVHAVLLLQIPEVSIHSLVQGSSAVKYLGRHTDRHTHTQAFEHKYVCVHVYVRVQGLRVGGDRTLTKTTANPGHPPRAEFPGLVCVFSVEAHRAVQWASDLSMSHVMQIS